MCVWHYMYIVPAANPDNAFAYLCVIPGKLFRRTRLIIRAVRVFHSRYTRALNFHDIKFNVYRTEGSLTSANKVDYLSHNNVGLGDKMIDKNGEASCSTKPHRSNLKGWKEDVTIAELGFKLHFTQCSSGAAILQITSRVGVRK